MSIYSNVIKDPTEKELDRFLRYYNLKEIYPGLKATFPKIQTYELVFENGEQVLKVEVGIHYSKRGIFFAGYTLQKYQQFKEYRLGPPILMLIYKHIEGELGPVSLVKADSSLFTERMDLGMLENSEYVYKDKSWWRKVFFVRQRIFVVTEYMANPHKAFVYYLFDPQIEKGWLGYLGVPKFNTLG